MEENKELPPFKRKGRSGSFPGSCVEIRRANFIYRLVRIFGYVSFQAIYRLRVEGQGNIPSRGPCLILPKHQFWTDSPIVGWAVCRPLNYIAKQELFVYPGVRQFITLLGGIPVNRLHPIKSLDSFRYIDRLLKMGEYIVLFPEGTYYPHTMGEGKYRFIQRLLRFREEMGWHGPQAIPFVPVGISYDEKKFRTEIKVRIGQPLYAKEESDGKLFTLSLLQRIAELSGLNVQG